MKVTVKRLTGKVIELDIEPTEKVEKIKERLEKIEHIVPAAQRLIVDSKYFFSCLMFVEILSFKNFEESILHNH